MKLRDIFNEYREIILYIIFGVLTTIVNFIVYFALRYVGISYRLSNTIAILISIIFAYLTNRKYVFSSKVSNFSDIIKEFSKFFGCRMFSFVADMFAMVLFIDFMAVSEILAKFGTAVIVTIMNYVFSKLLIFKNQS